MALEAHRQFGLRETQGILTCRPCSRDIVNIANPSGHRYVALKVYVHTSRFHRELPVYEEMGPKFAATKLPGRNNIRRLLDQFEVAGPHGRHIVLAMQPAQMSLRDMKLVFMKDGGFDESFVKGAVQELLKALDFLHGQASVIHTGLSAC